MAIIAAVLKAQTAVRFTHLSDGGEYLRVSEGGRRVTPTGGGMDNWAIGTPALCAGGCVRVTVPGQSDYALGSKVSIGVIGTTDPIGYSFRHATATGWQGRDGYAYYAGKKLYSYDGWPPSGWRDGDTAALMIDTAADTLTLILKHRRERRAFTIELRDDVAEWFVIVSGGSVEVQPMTPAEYDAFLP